MFITFKGLRAGKNISYSVLAVLGFCGAVAPLPCSATSPPVPPAFQDIYTTLNSDLQAFNTTLNGLWNGGRYPVLYTGTLTNANSNTGPQLINPGYLTSVENQLQELKAVGVQAIAVTVSFPMLYEPFFASQSEFQQYVNFYTQVAAIVRAAGLKLIVENQCLAAGTAMSGWNIGPFYAGLSWTQYQQARAQTALTIAQTMQPDYMVLVEEPDTEATMSGQANVNTVSGSTSMLDQILVSVRQSGVIGMKVGAGVGTWLGGFQGFINSFTRQGCSASQPCISSPLDFIDMHVYPINNMGPPSNANFLANALSIANMAHAAGLPVTLGQLWVWKLSNSEWGVLGGDETMARNAFSFWAPLDQYFTQIMIKLANYTQMIFMAPFDTQYFSAYLTYNSSTANLTPAENFAQEATASSQAMQKGVYTSTARSYYNAILSPPDTIPPSMPGAFTGFAPSPSSANVTWTESTDNIGVAGYAVLRDGQQIATTINTYYQDSALTHGTTYNYAVRAYDLGGNRSTSAAVSIMTPPPNPPNNLTGTAVSSHQINLAWLPPTGKLPISSYLIFRGTSASTLTQVAQVAGSATSFHNYYLTPGTKYDYVVKSTSSGYTSAKSTVIAVTTQP